ncbi:MAG: ribonuclease BN, partial [Bacteroidetes bacterium]
MLKSFKHTEFIHYLKTISLPGFEGVPVWDVVLFFWEGLINGVITTRASAIAFNFFLAIFPMLLFLFSLIAYVPIANFQTELMRLLVEIMPRSTFLTVQDTVSEILLRQRFDLLSVGFISMLVFATNGINSLMTAFGATYHPFKEHHWFRKYFVSMFLVCVLSVLIITAVALAISGRYIIDNLVQQGIVDKQINYYLLLLLQWGVILLFFFSAIALLYYFAPSKRGKFRLFSAGNTLATLLMLFSSYGFSYYINNFGQYNKLYGSIGTVIVILLWLYF